MLCTPSKPDEFPENLVGMPGKRGVDHVAPIDRAEPLPQGAGVCFTFKSSRRKIRNADTGEDEWVPSVSANDMWPAPWGTVVASTSRPLGR